MKDKINSLYNEYQDYRKDKETKLTQLHHEILHLKEQTILTPSIPEQKLSSSQDQDTQIEHLNTVILHKDTQITQLQQQLNHSKQQEQHLENTIDKQTKDIQNLRRDHNQLSQEIQSYKTASDHYDIKTQSIFHTQPEVTAEETHYHIPQEDSHRDLIKDNHHTETQYIPQEDSQRDLIKENHYTETQYIPQETTFEEFHPNVFENEDSESPFEFFNKAAESPVLNEFFSKAAESPAVEDIDTQPTEMQYEHFNEAVESPQVEQIDIQHKAPPPPPKASAFNLKPPTKPSGESFSQNMPIPSYHMPSRKTGSLTSHITSSFSREESEPQLPSPAQDYTLDPFSFQTTATSYSIESQKNEEKQPEHIQNTDTLNPFASSNSEEPSDIFSANYWETFKQTSTQPEKSSDIFSSTNYWESYKQEATQPEKPSELFSSSDYWESSKLTTTQQEKPSELFSSNYWESSKLPTTQQEEPSELFSSSNHWEAPKQTSSQEGLAGVFKSEEDQSSPFIDNFWNAPKDSAASFFNNVEEKRSSKQIEPKLQQERVWQEPSQQDPFAFFKGMEEVPLEEDAGYVNPLKSLFR